MTKTKAHFAIETAQSEIRTRVMEIRALGDDKLTDALRVERDTLDKKYAEGEVRFRAAIAAMQTEQAKAITIVDSEARELQLLTDKATVVEAIMATSEHRLTVGETAEIQQHYHLPSNSIPIEMLRVDRRVEQRAAATVPASIGDASQGDVALPVFASGDGAFLQIERPVVDVGDATYPILGTAPTVSGPFSDSSDTTTTTAAFTANNLSPERLSAQYSYRRTDASRFAGLDSSLRLALNGGLMEALDEQAISGTDGLLTGTNLDNNNVSAVTTFALYLSGLLYGRVDGRFAGTPSDVRILVGQGTFTHAAAAYKGNNSDESGVERLGSRSGGFRVSPHVPDVSGNKQNCLIRLGGERGAAVQPTWRNVALVVDEVTRALQGEVLVTAFLESNFAIVGANRWHKQQTQHA